jgi:excisionase family DNA binding protein
MGLHLVTFCTIVPHTEQHGLRRREQQVTKIAEGATTTVDPIFISVAETAQLLNLTKWSIYQLCDKQELDSQYHGRRRLVRLSSVRAWADSLPTTPDVA